MGRRGWVRWCEGGYERLMRRSKDERVGMMRRCVVCCEGVAQAMAQCVPRWYRTLGSEAHTSGRAELISAAGGDHVDGQLEVLGGGGRGIEGEGWEGGGG